MIKSEDGRFTVEGNAAAVCADLGIAILGVRDSLIEYAEIELGEANAVIATVCADALAIDPAFNKKGEN